MRSHHSLLARNLASCGHCGKPVLGHAMCSNCGYYKGRQVIDVMAKLDKKERKKKEKELHDHEKSENIKERSSISAEELSHK